MARKLIDFILSADSSRFRQGMQTAERTSKRSATSIGGHFSRLNISMTRLAGTVLSLAGAGGFIALARNVTQNADAYAKMAQQTGVAVENLSTLDFVVRQSGASQNDLQRSLRNLSRGMLELEEGSGRYGEQLGKLGIETRDANGVMRGSYDVLLDIADLFQDLPDGPEKVAIAYETLGRAGQTLIPLLNQGSEGIKAQQAAAAALGAELDTRTAQSAERFNDAMDSLGTSMQGVVREGIAPLLPVMAALTEEAAAGTSGFRSFASDVGTFVSVLARGVIGVFSTVRTAVRELVILTTGAGRTLAAVLRGDFRGAMREARTAMEAMVDEGNAWGENMRGLIDIQERGNAVLEEETERRRAQEAAQQRAQDTLKRLREEQERLAKVEEERRKRAEEQQKVVDGLRRELAMIDLVSDAEKMRYEVTEGAYSEFDQATKDRIMALARELEHEQQLREEREANRKAAEEEAKNLQTLADQFVASTRTELELLEQERAQLESIRDLIDGETYDRALASIQERIAAIGEETSEWEEFSLQAARNMQDAFADFLFDPFEDGLDGMLRGFADTVRRMAAEALSQQILRGLFGGTGFGAAAFGFASGGLVRGPGTDTSDSIPARLSRNEFVQPAHAVRYYGADFMEAIRRHALPRFAAGGLVRPDVARFAEGGPVGGGAGGAAGGEGVGVRIINNVDPDMVEEYLASASGERVVVNTIKRNAGAIRNALG